MSNFSLECHLQFSRLTLSVDTGVSTVNFAEMIKDLILLLRQLFFHYIPIVQGTAGYHLPSGCMVSSLAVNRATCWRTINHGGFSLRQSGNDTFLQV